MFFVKITAASHKHMYAAIMGAYPGYGTRLFKATTLTRGTWALTREWALTQDTTGTYNHYKYMIEYNVSQ